MIAFNVSKSNDRISVPVCMVNLFQRISDTRSLEEFVREDDAHRFGGRGSLNELNEHVKIQIVNDFQKLSGLHAHLGSLDLLNPCHLRPDWDTYFMVCFKPLTSLLCANCVIDSSLACLSEVKLHEASRWSNTGAR